MNSPPAPESRLLGQQLALAVLAQLHGTPPRQALLEAGHLVNRLQDSLLYVESGRLDAVMQLDDQGAQVIPVSFRPGEFAFLSGLFSQAPLKSALVAAEPTRVLVVPRDRVEQILLANKSLLVLLVRFLSHRLIEVRARERGWLERGVQGRVRSVLARVALDHVPDVGAPWLITETHEHLALRCGVSRSKLTMQLKQLESEGILMRRRGVIEVLDYAGLAGDGP